MPTLHITLPDGGEQTHELTDDMVTIGRLSDNTIQIDDASVSSHHAQLTLQGDYYVFQDLGSTNGSRMNGKRLEMDEEVSVQDGDVIRVGNINVLYASDFESGEQPLPSVPGTGATTSTQSNPPTNFSNASPFPARKAKKDPFETALISFAVLAILAFGGAVASIFMIKPPVF